MKSLLLAILLLCSFFMYGQTTKTIIKDIGKVGNLGFTLTKIDTASVLMIMQSSAMTASYGSGMVFIKDNEIEEVAGVIKMFIEETSVKTPVDGTVINHYTKDSVNLSCSYSKPHGWFVMIMNPVLQKKAIPYQSASYKQNYFVQIKPKQLDDVLKTFSKAAAMVLKSH